MELYITPLYIVECSSCCYDSKYIVDVNIQHNSIIYNSINSKYTTPLYCRTEGIKYITVGKYISLYTSCIVIVEAYIL